MNSARAHLRAAMLAEVFDDASSAWTDLKTLWSLLSVDERQTLMVFGAEGRDSRITEAMRLLDVGPASPLHDAA